MCIYVDTKCYVFMCMYMPAMLLQLCLTLWDSKDCMQTSSSSVQGILQARILEWVAMPFSRDLPNPGIEPEFLTSPGFFTTSATWGTHLCVCMLAQKVKNPPAMQETWVRSLSWEDHGNSCPHQLLILWLIQQLRFWDLGWTLRSQWEECCWLSLGPGCGTDELGSTST